MKTRAPIIQEGYALNDAGTHTISIDLLEPLSAIEFIFGGTKGATENQSDKIQDYIKLIELVDGSDVVWSLSMKEAVALNCFEMGVKPAHKYDLGAGGTPQETVWINFGRFLHDPEYWLEPTRFRNLQLRIVTNLTAGAGTYVSDSLSVDVVLHVIEEGAGSNQGYFAANEIYSWTTAASGDETVDMPTTYPWRMLMVGAEKAGIAPNTKITDIKLTANGDRIVFFDFDTADLVLRNRSEFGLFADSLKSNMADADTLNASLFDILEVSILGGDETAGVRCEAVAGNQMTFAAFEQT